MEESINPKEALDSTRYLNHSELFVHLYHMSSRCIINVLLGLIICERIFSIVIIYERN